jgi:hypothetical protein
MNNTERAEHLLKTCQAYDRLAIVVEQLMERWLDGNANPPEQLIEEYWAAKADIGELVNVGRLHEEITRPNGEFFEKLNSKFGLDNTPNLW